MRGLITSIACVWSLCAHAVDEQVYLTEDAFVSRTFGEQAPPQQALWLSPELREQLEEMLAEPVGLRLRYWLADDRSLWVLNRVGKDHPITSGFVVSNKGLQDVQVLIYRESRGWEVKHDFFTDQFLGATLNRKGKLDRTINNITGATLSVRAMRRMGRAALLLHNHITQTP